MLWCMKVPTSLEKGNNKKMFLHGSAALFNSVMGRPVR